jgi:hypothetical protein
MQYFASDNLGTNEEKIRFWRYTPPIEQQIIKYIPFSSILKEYPFYFREIQECGNLLFGGAPFTPRYGQCNWNAPDENCYKKLRISFLLQIDIFGCGMELFPMIWTARNEEPYCNPIEYSLPIINKAFGGLDQTYDVQFFDCQKIDYYFNWKYQSCENMGSGFLANFGATGIDKTIFLLTE